MAMLAEPRRKQKWTLNPRGKHWSDDSNKFGQKMLEKMGWTSGKGLGANLDGMTEHIRARYKNDQAGIGFSNEDRNKQWTQHQDGYNDLLQKLQDGETADTSSKDNELSGKSLELKSKESRARVHYRKFTRGKDVNKYSTKDLANIFGKKDFDDKSEGSVETVKLEMKVENEETYEEPVGSSDTSHGIVTIKGGSITDYFKNKISSLGRKSSHDEEANDVKNEAPSDDERYTGFGFTETRIKREKFSFENPAMTENDDEKYAGFGYVETRIKKEKFSFENPAMTENDDERHADFGYVETRIKKEKFSFENPAMTENDDERHAGFGYVGTRMKKEKFSFENPALALANSPEMSVTPGKRKNDYVFENPALELGDSPSEIERTPKRRKSEFAFENAALDLEHVPNGDLTPSGSAKKMKNTKYSSLTQNSVETPRSEESPRDGETFDSIRKKKRRKKSKECCTVPVEGFTNEALNLEIRDGRENEKDENQSNVGQFEVSRSHFGLANDALDLTDESSGKKRVTFNDKVEYDTAMANGKRSKNKNAGKLDKFEIDNDKLRKNRKKKKKGKRTTDIDTIDSVFVNAAMDVEIFSEEANDNAMNERKAEKARRKRERRVSSLETIVEASEEEKESSIVVPEVVTHNDSLVGEASENLEILSLDTPQRKRKKRRKDIKDEEIIKLHESPSTSTFVDQRVDDLELIEGFQSPKIRGEKTPKRDIKSENNSVEIEDIIENENTVKKNKKRKKESVDEETREMEIIEETGETPKSSQRDKTKRRIEKEPGKNMNKENVDVINENTKIVESAKNRKKQRKEKNRYSKEFNDLEEISGITMIEIAGNDTTPDVQDKIIEEQWNGEVANSHVEMQAGLRSPWDGKAKRSKKIFKALFARSPVVHFAGSNINEIKGYGIDIN